MNFHLYNNLYVNKKIHMNFEKNLLIFLLDVLFHELGARKINNECENKNIFSSLVKHILNIL